MMMSRESNVDIVRAGHVASTPPLAYLRSCQPEPECTGNLNGNLNAINLNTSRAK